MDALRSAAPAASAPELSAAVAEVDLSALTHNLGVVRRHLAPGAEVLAVVKANAYGHGLPGTALHLESQGVRWFGVATPAEALALRAGGVTAKVLLLSPVAEPDTVAALAARGVALTVPGEDALRAIAAARLPEPVEVHIKLDTGMGRIGARTPAEAARLAVAAARTDGVRMGGTFTHLYASEEEDEGPTREQLARFEKLVAAIRDAGVDPGLRHTANSGAVFRFADHHYDLVRPGIVLYGYYPGPLVASLAPGLRPAMRLTAPVSFVKRLPPGATVSYGGLWRAERETVVATVRAGYADGFRRSLTGRARVGHRGRLLEVIGRVCMDQLMVDATGADVAVGDRVVLWGPGGPSAEEHAAAIGTVAYEMLTGVAARVGRVYVPTLPPLD
ncbi:MAG TPA: alanine racemase [Trueperaceae bacterium]